MFLASFVQMLIKEVSPPPSGIALPHQQEIERMSSFRDQLGEDWLRYQHHLDGPSHNQPRPQTPPLRNGANHAAAPPEAPKVLPPPQHTSLEPCYVDEEQDTESTLQWPSHSPQPTESTLEESAVDGPPLGPTRLGRGSEVSVNGDSEDSRAEEEEDLGGKSLVTFDLT